MPRSEDTTDARADEKHGEGDRDARRSSPSVFAELVHFGKTRHIQRYTALYWEPTLGRVILNDGQSLRCSANEWVFVALLNYEPIAEWLSKSGINFGSSARTARRWMVVDDRGMKAYAVAEDVARRWVEQQRKPE